MNKKELIDQMVGVPDDARIFMYTDHGQQTEEAYGLSVTTLPKKVLEDMEPEEIQWISPAEYYNHLVTAVMIS